LAEIARLLSDHHVSVETLHQTVNISADGTNQTATLAIATHSALEARGREMLEALAANPVVTGVTSVLRVEG
jgi:homoserine dehydrogenase